MPYFVYILECKDKSLYTGCTIDLAARVRTHSLGKGAKYTRTRLPITLKYKEKLRTYGLARQREAEIKSWSREKKQRLIRNKKKSYH